LLAGILHGRLLFGGELFQYDRQQGLFAGKKVIKAAFDDCCISAYRVNSDGLVTISVKQLICRIKYPLAGIRAGIGFAHGLSLVQTDWYV
jgi:hypothetical protein